MDRTQDVQPSSLTIAFYIIHEIIFVLFALFGIAMDVLLIYTVAKYERVRTIRNIYIANWAAADIVSLILTPSAYNILEVLYHISGDAYLTISSIAFLLGIIAHALVNMSVVILLTDWLLTTFFPRTSETLHRYYKYVLAILWSVAVVLSIASVTTCQKFSICYLGAAELLVTFGLVILLVASLQLVRCAKKCRNRPLRDSALCLTMATTFVLVWIIGFSNIIFMQWQFEHPLLSSVLDCLTFSSALINIGLFYYNDVDFQACLTQVLKRSKYREGIDQYNDSAVVNRDAADVNNVM